MKFNLLETAYVTISGTPYICLMDVQDILTGNGSTVISGTGNHNLFIDCDIVDRISVYQIRYYFDSTTDSGTVASGIHFYYKNDSIDSYSSLLTQLGSGFYYAEVPDLSAPRYIKLNHTVSGTAITGTIVGFEVLNNDDVVDFGSDGGLESTTVVTTLDYLNNNDYIREIEVYNDGDSPATAHIFIEPQYSDTDELLSISASEDGPWIFARNTDYIISNGNNWDVGRYVNTSTSEISDGKLRLSSGQSVGTYTTPIFRNESVKFASIDMLQTTISGAIVAVDSDDYTSTIQIRSSSFRPIDYNVYRVLYYSGASYNNQFWYKDFLITTDTEVYDSYNATGQRFGASWSYYSYVYEIDHTQFTIDKNTQKIAFIAATFHSSGYYAGTYWIDVYLLSMYGVQFDTVRLTSAGVNTYGNNPYNTNIYDMKFDSDDGLCLYIYVNFTSNSYNTSEALNGTIDNVGYFLIHLNSNLNVTYSSGARTSNFITGFWAPAVVGGTSIWYCNLVGTIAVIKMSATGTVEISYDDVTELSGLCATNDGGCWFIEGDNLYKLNSLGILVDSITNLDIGNSLDFVEFDQSDTDFLWIVDGVYIKRIRLDGTIFSTTYLEGFTINRLLSTSEGLWIYCTEATTSDKYVKYIGKSSLGVEKTIECVTNGGLGYPADIGIRDVSYNNISLGNLIPLPDDPVWNDTLEWNKTVTNNAILPREEYNQLKLTLRRPSVDIDSPIVENIYYQDSVELVDIYPGQSKTLYLKTSIPTGMSVAGDYSSMLKVWWELPAP